MRGRFVLSLKNFIEDRYAVKNVDVSSEPVIKVVLDFAGQSPELGNETAQGAQFMHFAES